MNWVTIRQMLLGFLVLLAFPSNSFGQLANPDFAVRIATTQTVVLLDSSQAARPALRQSIIRICVTNSFGSPPSPAVIAGVTAISISQPPAAGTALSFDSLRCGLFLTNL